MQEEIIERIKAGIPDADVQVSLDGNRVLLEVCAQMVDGMNRVKRQQAVYACINEFIADGRLHAVTIKATTPTD